MLQERRIKRFAWAVLASLSLWGIPAQAESPSTNQAFALAKHLGVDMLATDPRLSDMQSKLNAGKGIDAAMVVEKDPDYLNIKIRDVFSPLTFLSESVGVLNDATALAMCLVRDHSDIRGLLTSSNVCAIGGSSPPYSPFVAYNPNSNASYTAAETAGIPIAQNLVYVSQPFSDSAGMLTSHQWMSQHAFNGTYRRMVQFAFREFLCSTGPITNYDVSGVPHDSLDNTYVGMDLDPNGGAGLVAGPMTFQGCLNCHGGMDSLRSAFAYWGYDATTGAVHYSLDEQQAGIALDSSVYSQVFVSGSPLAINPNVVTGSSVGINIPVSTAQSTQNAVVANLAQPINRHLVNPNGFVVTSNNWLMRWTDDHSHPLYQSFGWTGSLSGKGVRSFATLLANSGAFASCMAMRAFTAVCNRAPDMTASDSPNDAGAIAQLATDLQNHGYDFNYVMAEAAVLPQCLGNGN